MKAVALLSCLLLFACTTSVTNYDDCVAKGYPVIKTYPGKCTTPDGQIFIQKVSDAAVTNFDECADAGYPIQESYPPRCIADGVSYTEENCQDGNGHILTLSDAVDIGKESACGDSLIVACVCPEGMVKEGDACNPSCYYSEPRCLAPSRQCEKSTFCNEGTYWIDLNLNKTGCSPACVINLENRTAEINWRCTGLLPD
jgi:hypothetical protein